MARPYQKANIPGPEMGTSVKDPKVMANIIKAPKKKVFVIGSEALTWELDGKKVADYYIEIAKKLDCLVIATGHIYKYLKEHIDTEKLVEMSLINITNRLSDKEWKGLDGKGQYEMAIFGGHLVFYSSQTLSRLKNFTNWVRTVELDKYSHPNARFSLPNLSDAEWKKFLEELIENL
ncbi:MAG: CO dehydrogenase/acetyl-CoA synthase complex subunit epsilon [Candidatus Lokiarchaeota archaeon]|nr:CO dehydrogenase/acetyl-CoA synthase complex subunit epsilon [Candidatus Lokiarchaeota archaeon]MBD3201019.1 CO dehydrogenase/acetyl-CoA synthase complex subunit epsilon [Candidatus Lokiarchaeota archaeon]